MQYLWKHKKTGHLYRIMGFALIEKGLLPAVVYARDGEMTHFVRPCDEFFDGRFRQVDVTPIERDETSEEINEAALREAKQKGPLWASGELDDTMELQVIDGKSLTVTMPGVDDEAATRRRAERFGGAVSPDSVAAKAERLFAAKKGGEAL